MRVQGSLIALALAAAGCGGNRPLPPAAVPVPVKPPATVPVATQPIAVAPVPPEVRPPVPVKPAPVEAIARVNGVEIPRERFLKPLIEAHGLNVLMQLVQLELAKQQAAKLNITVTADDVRAETDMTLRQMFKDVNPKVSDELRDAEATHQDELAKRLREQLERDTQTMLDQLLQQQKSSRAEFDLLMETNCYLRKSMEQLLQGRLSEENVRVAFNLTYGETVRVKHIQCGNMQEIAEVQRRLSAGEAFEKVAQDLSRNAITRNQGGSLPPFSRETPGLPAGFKEVAFALSEPGEVSEPVHADDTYHLLKLVERIAPKAVKFEDVKDSVRQHLFASMVQEQMKSARAELARQALDTLEIKEPALAAQFKARLTLRENELRDRDQINRELERQRLSAPPALPTTAPNRMSSDATGTGVARPPATQSGLDTPDKE